MTAVALLLALLAIEGGRASAQIAGIEVQKPWAYTRHIDRSSESVLYMATTPAIEDDDLSLLLACRQDGPLIISFIHINGFPYQLAAPTNVSLRVDLAPTITLPASIIQDRQISIEPPLGNHMLRALTAGDQLFVAVTDRRGETHDYSMALQPNDLALKDIRANCLEPFLER